MRPMSILVLLVALCALLLASVVDADAAPRGRVVRRGAAVRQRTVVRQNGQAFCHVNRR